MISLTVFLCGTGSGLYDMSFRHYIPYSKLLEKNPGKWPDIQGIDLDEVPGVFYHILLWLSYCIRPFGFLFAEMSILCSSTNPATL